jgi:hypothetical protein
VAEYLIDRSAAEESIRASVLTFAEGFLRRRDPAEFFADAAPCYKPKDYPAKSWCQIFCLFCYRACDLTVVHWQDRLGFAGLLPTISRELAKPADMTILQNNKYGDPVWHGNLLVRTDGFTDHTLDGNTSEGVAARSRDIRIYKPRPVYKSIQPWVDAFVASLEGLKSLHKNA